MKTRTATASTLALLVAVSVLASGSHAAPAEKLLLGAGPVPTEARMRAAVLKYLQTTDRALDSRKPFKVLSGPTLATGNTFGGSLEQAWLMCLVVNAEKIAPGPQEIQGKALYLRTQGGQVVVVPTENWKDSSPQC
ncbi:MAG: hypothetical protein H7228_09250 [Polaromonas sp.]|nr:hypothetical protein [Polaromonas sp.]